MSDPMQSIVPLTSALDLRVQQHLDDAKAPNTRRAYTSHWRQFTIWAETQQGQALPATPALVAGYLADLAATGAKVSTMAAHLAAIRHAHLLAGQETPTTNPLVTQTLAGIRRQLGSRPRQVEPVSVDLLQRMSEVQPDTLRGVRNRALLLLGFAGALRRSELSSLTVDDLERTDDGFVLTLKRSKTDQTGEGRIIGIPVWHPSFPLSGAGDRCLAEARGDHRRATLPGDRPAWECR